ncbi:pyruvate ferredoxin oxidoreductase [bacterium]|nr:pyruvate ferredoxin oxidoreductase [bacterium]
MRERKGVEVSIAAADAAAMADIDLVAAYPITPQTHIVEHLSELVASGELDAQYIAVESEHSAMSVCCGSSAVGARTFTCTSSQGLALMNEIVFLTASLRLPIVMITANRSLSGPLSIWNDHSDVMSVRDCGWIQIFAENGQDVFDQVLFCFRVAENPEVSLPVMLNIDGFALTHVIEPVEYWNKEDVKKFLPDFEPVNRLNPDDPITLGALAMPDIFTEIKKAQDQALINSKTEILKAWQEIGEITGRFYKPVETYKAEGAKILFLTMGSIGETVSIAIDELRDKGEDVGLLKLRLWRPFPFEELFEEIRNAKEIIVIDRAVSFGGPGGPVASEIRSALYGRNNMPQISSYICGLAGRDVIPEDYISIYHRVKEDQQKELRLNNSIYYGVRE